VALTKLKLDSDKDFQDMLQLAEKISFDLDLFEKRYKEELRDNTEADWSRSVDLQGRPSDSNDNSLFWPGHQA
jgi:hypothetical protein